MPNTNNFWVVKCSGIGSATEPQVSSYSSQVGLFLTSGGVEPF